MSQRNVSQSQLQDLSREQMEAVVDHFGWYQRRLYLFIAFPLIMTGYTSMSVVLLFASPHHRCQVPGLANDTFSIQNDAHRILVNLSIPMASTDGDVSYSKCDVYKDRDAGHSNRTLYDDTEPCNNWVYDDTDFKNTIVTQFDLVCGEKGFRANYNMVYMLGLLLGSSLSGVLCDRLGRKKVFLWGMTLAIVVTVAVAFPVATPLLLVYRFLMAVLNIIMYMSVYVLTLEFMGPKRRTLAGSLIVVVWIFGPFLLGVLSYVIRDWRWLQALNGAPFVLCLSYLWVLDESPRWLLSKGRVQEAQRIILKVMKVNKMTTPPDGSLAAETLRMTNVHLQNSIPKAENKDVDKEKTAETDEETKTLTDEEQSTVLDKEKETEEEIPQQSFLGLFKYPNLIARTCIIFFNWSVISTSYFGLSLNVANLSGDLRLNFFFSNFVELVGTCAAWFCLDRLGRKHTLCMAMLLCGTSCLATIFPVMFGGSELQWVTVLLVMLGKLGISAAFATIYLMTGELFPTVIRNQGLGFSSTVARVATALSPYIADLSLHIEGSVGKAVPLVIFGSLALAAGLLALCLPETLHRTLPDTILQAASFTRQHPDDPAGHVIQVTDDSDHSP